ncbi:MAG: DUF3306 domain-containing protein [Paracoccaceae bacterium]|nr:DUF3306 domain-containing protein [Paracoccaceae bacterium]
MSDFWARRKAAVEAEARADEAALAAEERAQREAELAEKPDAEILQELGLPDPDDLNEGDDFRQFLTEAVPARLKTRALRRLWRVNPVLANLDGLLDYGEDFTDSALVVENLQTAYQVGKGMLAHVEEMARQAEEKLAVAEDDTAEPEAPEGEEVEVVETAAADPVEAPEPPAPVTFQTTNPEPEIARAPRRMRFHFDGATA